MSVRTLQQVKMRKIALLLACGFATLSGYSQEEDLLADFDNEPETEYSEAGFKTTRVANSHSYECTYEGVMDFRISHRFGAINSGFYELFGLDQASIRLGLDYGITDNLGVGIGRSSYQKTYDGFLKYRFLRQSTGAKNMPVTATWVSTMAVNTLKVDESLEDYAFENRLSYTHQLLIGRKFNEAFTFQLAPSYVHRNLVETSDDPNGIWALGVQGRTKVSKRTSLNIDYYYGAAEQLGEGYDNSLTLGVDIETGGHVFQLLLSNSLAQIEKGFIGETTGKWLDGDIYMGFNVSRVFTVKKPKEFRD